MRNNLKKFITIRTANAITGTIIGFIIESGRWSIGESFVNWSDSRDKEDRTIGEISK